MESRDDEPVYLVLGQDYWTRWKVVQTIAQIYRENYVYWPTRSFGCDVHHRYVSVVRMVALGGFKWRIVLRSLPLVRMERSQPSCESSLALETEDVVLEADGSDRFERQHIFSPDLRPLAYFHRAGTASQFRLVVSPSGCVSLSEVGRSQSSSV